VYATPVVVVIEPLGVELVGRFALLLDPGVVLEVVNAESVVIGKFEHPIGSLRQHMNVVILFRHALVVSPFTVVHLLDPRAVHVGRIRKDSENHVMFRQTVVLCHLHGTYYVGYSRDPQEG